MSEEPGTSEEPDLAERTRLGLQTMQQVYGFTMGPPTDDFSRYTVDHLFGDVWRRDGLGLRERRLLLLGMLAATHQDDVLRLQVPAALANGELTPTELREVVVFVCHYAGWPAGSRLHAVVEEAIAGHRPG